MKKASLIFTILLMSWFQTYGQGLGLTFQEAQIQGITIKHLDSLYKSALHSDSSLAVFKTQKEQEAMSQAYVEMLKNFGKFLNKNNFSWDKPTKCFNRIYFNSDGTIDYFLFNFLGKKEEKPSKEKETKFQELLNLFISDYKFPLTADTKFSQCSPTTYMTKQ